MPEDESAFFCGIIQILDRIFAEFQLQVQQELQSLSCCLKWKSFFLFKYGVLSRA